MAAEHSTPSHTSGSLRAATRRRVLVLDDELAIQRLLKMILEEEGYTVLNTDDGAQALEMMGREHVDLVIQDLRMPKMDGLTFLKRLKESFPDTPSIVLTAFGTFETAVEAMRLGAYTHLGKPFDTGEMRETVARALERHAIGRKTPRSGLQYLDMVSNTSVMAQVSSLVDRVAPTDSTVLITGESGTGKELIARAIHFGSLRAEQPFVPVNCGAFAETLLESELFGHIKGSFTNAIADRKGVFESADRGTLFLDEVGELTMPTQVKLLRVLETRSFKPVGGTKETKVDVRIIAATNRNLAQMAIEGQFREDLYYRLNVIPIELPPLRERKEDIPLLAGHFLAKFAKRMGKQIDKIDDAVIEKLVVYSWPGNVRQLENTLERAVALSRGDRITIADLAGPVLGLSSTGTSGRLTPTAVPDSRSSARFSAPVYPAPSSLPPPSVQRSVTDTHGSLMPTTSIAETPAEPEVLLPPNGIDLEKHLLDRERAYILQALERSNGNLTDAAKLLNMTFRSIRYRVSKLGIERPSKNI
jgi:two-component system response regulator PilR (NtrC family)